MYNVSSKEVLTVCLLILSSICLGQQQLFQFSFELKAVSYVSGTGSGYIVVQNDSSQNYYPPHFDTATGERKPVAYVSGSSPNIQVTIETNCDSLYIRGVNEIMLFEMDEDNSPSATGDDGFNTVIVSANTTFEEGVIKYYEDFEISWEVSSDGQTWNPIGNSVNTIYVTGGTPYFPFLDNYSYETVYDISCRAADGLTARTVEEAQNVIDVIFNNAFKKDLSGQFPGLRRTSDHRLLTYYGVNPSEISSYDCSTSLIGLLETSDGRCGAIAELFVKCINIQGIDDIIEFNYLGIYPEPTDSDTLFSSYGHILLSDSTKARLALDYSQEFSGETISDENFEFLVYHFLVKNWTVTPRSFITLYNGECNEQGSWQAYFTAGESGIVGQGNVQNPRSIFADHVATSYQHNLLDPSYGIRFFDPTGMPFSNTTEYENVSIDVSTGAFLRRQISPEVCEYYFWVEKMNNTTSQEFFTNF